MNCAPITDNFKKVPMQPISGPGILPGSFYLSLIDDYILRLHDLLLSLHPLYYQVIYTLLVFKMAKETFHWSRCSNSFPFGTLIELC